MSTRERHKIKNRIDNALAWLFLLAALFVFGLSGRLAGFAQSANPVLEKLAVGVTLEQCGANLDALQVRHSRMNPGSIRIVEVSGRSLPSILERGTLIQQACPGLVLSQFCAGARCESGAGLEMTLSVEN